MADELDPKVTAAYRELGAQEPPHSLDEAILAASRRPARSRTQRWAVPLALAAVVVLSVTVTLRIQHEAPELPLTAQQQQPVAAKEAAREEAAPVKPAAEAAPEEPAPLRLKPESQIKQRARPEEKALAWRADPKAFADAAPAAPGPAASASRNDAPRVEEARREMARSAESGSSGSALGRIDERTSRDAEAAARAPQAGALFAKRDSQAPAAAPAPQPAAKPAPPAAAAAPPPASAPEQLAKLQGETPEREFERIAQLRAEGRHDEADKAFLEFRRRYPNFRITEEMLRRVERK